MIDATFPKSRRMASGLRVKNGARTADRVGQGRYGLEAARRNRPFGASDPLPPVGGPGERRQGRSIPAGVAAGDGVADRGPRLPSHAAPWGERHGERRSGSQCVGSIEHKGLQSVGAVPQGGNPAWQEAVQAPSPDRMPVRPPQGLAPSCAELRGVPLGLSAGDGSRSRRRIWPGGSGHRGRGRVSAFRAVVLAGILLDRGGTGCLASVQRHMPENNGKHAWQDLVLLRPEAVLQGFSRAFAAGRHCFPGLFRRLSCRMQQPAQVPMRPRGPGRQHLRFHPASSPGASGGPMQPLHVGLHGATGRPSCSQPLMMCEHRGRVRHDPAVIDAVPG